MILVDTSVWVDFFRGTNPQVANKVHQILDEDQVAMAIPIRIECLSGADRKQKMSLQRVFEALPIFYPAMATWNRMEEWIVEGRGKGEQFGAMDLLIASLAKEHDCSLWSLDGDFKRMESLGWIKTYSIQ